MKEKFSMKDAAFHEENISQLSVRIHNNYPQFQSKKFLASIFDTLHTLELKERSLLITDALTKHLPFDYEKNLSILMNSLPIENTDLEVTGFEGFIMMPLCSFVSRHGLEHFELSTSALYELTKRFTSEFDIRFFIERYPEKMLEKFTQWAEDDNVHIRRLVSEGTRSRLPWAFQLKKYIDDPSEIIPLLTLLKDDSELYVRRSVANNLNDISKDNPDMVIALLKQWQDADNKNMKWLIKHALRTLLKKGNEDALSLLGFSPSDALAVDISLSKEIVSLGNALEMIIKIKSSSKNEIPLMIDFIVWYQKANGKLLPKVFKLKQTVIKAKSSIEIKKLHKFADYSTRKHYAGKHQIALQINGKVYEKVTFDLSMS